MWPDRRIIELFAIEYPILLAPMAVRHGRTGDRGFGGGWTWCLSLRPVDTRSNPYGAWRHPAAHGQAGQLEFFHAYAARARRRTRGAMERAP